MEKPPVDLKNEATSVAVGFIVNPIAGMGGPVGLKGTDGKAILKKAKLRGAKPIASARAKSFLSELTPVRNRIRLLVGAGKMGEEEAQTYGFEYTVLGKKKTETTAKDTVEVGRRIVDMGVALLVFCGGDGTARDILKAVGARIPVLGVPAGVKMHSGLFAVNPEAAANMALDFLRGELPISEVEVMDVDEEAFRDGRLSAELYGYMLTPYEPCLIQGGKIASPMTQSELRNQAAIAIHIIESMKDDVIYIIGPGTTTRTIADLLDAKKTLLGVDLFYNKRLIAKDVNEKQILKKINRKTAQIILTPIGGQGFIFGRGNQQISPEVIRHVGWENIVIVATESKLKDLNTLRVDTSDPSLNCTLRKRQLNVITNYKTARAFRVE